MLLQKRYDLALDGHLHARPFSPSETTAAALFARAIVAEGLREAANGIDPDEIRRGIDYATEAAMAALEQCWLEWDAHGVEQASERPLSEIVLAELENAGPQCGAAGDAGSDARSALVRRLKGLRSSEQSRGNATGSAGCRKKARLGEALHALACARAKLSRIQGKTAGEEAGIAAVRFALDEPWRQIARLADKDPEVIVNSVLEGIGQYGVSAANRGAYADLVEAGALDSHKAIALALKSAAAVAGHLISGSDPICGGLRYPQNSSRFAPRQP